MPSLSFFVVRLNLGNNRATLNWNACDDGQLSDVAVVDPQAAFGQGVKSWFNAIVDVIISIVRRKEPERDLQRLFRFELRRSLLHIERQNITQEGFILRGEIRSPRTS